DCTDGEDNDCDGLVDCADPDCKDTPRPCDGQCGGGVELCDGAGGWSECMVGEGTGAEEICGDGIDQDCDGSDLRAPDEWEPNNSWGTAKRRSDEVDPDATIQARFDSVNDNWDCYTIEVEDSAYPTPENVQVRLSGIPSGHDYDVYLYADFDSCVRSDSIGSGRNSGNQDEYIFAAGGAADRLGSDESGLFYICVHRKPGHSCTEGYTLR